MSIKDCRKVWISISDKLPEKGKAVLVWSTLDDDYALGYLMTALNWHCQPLYGVNYNTVSGVSHWRELPLKPEMV